jgi:hypothetical protein
MATGCSCWALVRNCRRRKGWARRMADDGWQMAVLWKYRLVVRHPERSEGSHESETQLN